MPAQKQTGTSSPKKSDALIQKQLDQKAKSAAAANKKKKVSKKDPTPNPGPKQNPKKKPKPSAKPKVVVSSSVISSAIPTADPSVKNLYVKETQRLISSLINSSKDLLLSYNFSSIKSMPSFYLDLDREAKSSAILSARAFPVELTRSFSEMLLQDRILYLVNQIVPLIGDDVPYSTKLQSDPAKSPYYEVLFDDFATFYNLSLDLNAVGLDSFKVNVYKENNNNQNLYTATKSINVEYLVVAGGGGGGPGGANVGGAGGGAGGARTSTITLETGSPIALTIGSGGSPGTNGGNSVFASITSIGGGAGSGSNSVRGSSGGSGGGTTGLIPFIAGSGISGQGFAGGLGQGTVGVTVCSGGGGGGATSAGTQPASTSLAGVGGTGLTSLISGTSTVYSTGGSGRSSVSGANGASGAVNTGNGGEGGAGSTGVTAGSGGSGIVILKYPDTETLVLGSGVTGSTAAPSGGFKVTTITAGTGVISF